MDNFEQVFIFQVQIPTSKRSRGGNFESRRVETPSDYPNVQSDETSSLFIILFLQRKDKILNPLLVVRNHSVHFLGEPFEIRHHQSKW